MHLPPLSSEGDGQFYKCLHPEHVEKRLLKKVEANGAHRYSLHDAGWVDFMRSGHSMDAETIDRVTRAYSSGERVEHAGLLSIGQPWTRPYCPEVLFSGRIDFQDRNLDA